MDVFCCATLIQVVGLALLLSISGSSAKSLTKTRRHDRRHAPKSIQRISDVIADVCRSKGRDRLVYRYQNETDIFIGFDLVKKNLIYKMRWKVTGDKDESLIDQNKKHGEFDKVAADPLRRMLNTDALLAVTDKHQQSAFHTDLKSCSSRKKAVITMTCLKQAFAARAEAMKAVKIDRNCTPISSNQRHTNHRGQTNPRIKAD